MTIVRLLVEQYLLDMGRMRWILPVLQIDQGHMHCSQTHRARRMQFPASTSHMPTDQGLLGMSQLGTAHMLPCRCCWHTHQLSSSHMSLQRDHP
jgi:hypothetical protein